LDGDSQAPRLATAAQPELIWVNVISGFKRLFSESPNDPIHEVFYTPRS
jgi:hypothetical protein